MLTQSLSLMTSFVHYSQVHYQVCLRFLTNKITISCALHNFGQGVRKEGYDLITQKSK